MMIDTEVVLSGNAAHEFVQQMMSADMTAVNARDEFLSDVNSWVDESGVLNIDVDALDIDLNVLEEKEEPIEARSTAKKNKKSERERRNEVSEKH